MPDHGRAQRLDIVLTERGLARTRSQAKQLVKEGEVLVNRQLVTRPARLVTSDTEVQVLRSGPARVGRGARKLEHAFAAWGDRGLAATGLRCLDVGASTGGFTQVLLHHGAAQVIALDVGHHQLAPELVRDTRVIERSGTHVLQVSANDLGGPAELLVCDLSFISLRQVLAHLAALGTPDATLVALVKPQFELGPAGVGGSGVVRSPKQRRRALHAVLDAAGEAGWSLRDIIPSPIRGAAGNVEYLLWVDRDGTGMMDSAQLERSILDLSRREPR